MIITCRICGGDLHTHAGAISSQCNNCRTPQPQPIITSENIGTLFDKANRYLWAYEFDIAYSMYQSILYATKNSAEALWGMVLCIYGVVYEKDPRTGGYNLYCYRAQSTPILHNAFYLAALDNASSSYARRFYEEHAKVINNI